VLTTIALLAGTLLVGPDPVPADTTLTLGPRPTLIAFFGVPAALMQQEPMLEQVLADFQYSLTRARPVIEGLEFDVHEIYGQVIDLRTGDGPVSVPVTAGLPVGYYFWAPGQPAVICRGVRVDPDIVTGARVFLEDVRNGTEESLKRCERP
jgi:hypothetical protein